MTDRRTFPCNGRVADAALEGQVGDVELVTPQIRNLQADAWLRPGPGESPDRQLLYGDAFGVLEVRDGLAFGASRKDGYVGWIDAAALGPALRPTHRVALRTSWGYARPDEKSEALVPLHLNANVSVRTVVSGWSEIDRAGGSIFVPAAHLVPASAAIPVEHAARQFLGTPYVWAGNTGFGIDCSGLVQAAMHAARIRCAPDSDLQEAMPGERIGDLARTAVGDLIFWKGHVAIVVENGHIIHANAYHMSVVEEPVAEAVARIASGETGPITSILRPERIPLEA